MKRVSKAGEFPAGQIVAATASRVVPEGISSVYKQGRTRARRNCRKLLENARISTGIESTAAAFPVRRASSQGRSKDEERKKRSINRICPRFSPKQASRFENRNGAEEIYRESFIHGRWTPPRTVYIVLFEWTDCAKELLVSLFLFGTWRNNRRILFIEFLLEFFDCVIMRNLVT